MNQGIVILQWASAIWLGGLMLGITGLAIWLSLFTIPDPKKTNWHGFLLFRLGQGLILFTVALIVVGFIAATARGVWMILGGS